jgi:hypothetical protein
MISDLPRTLWSAVLYREGTFLQRINVLTDILAPDALFHIGAIWETKWSQEMRMHFTDVAISRLKTEGRYYDETTPAFGIRVGKQRKSWFVDRGRERSRKYFGRYPDKSLADARKEAKALLTQPVTKNERITFQAAYEVWKVAIEPKKPRTQRDYMLHGPNVGPTAYFL